MAARKTNDKPIPRMATDSYSANRSINKNNSWKKLQGEQSEYQGIQVFAAVDAYESTERKAFRSAMNNPYVYRASRIHATFCAGQGYTTEIVPRGEEEVPDEQLDAWQKSTSIYVPYWNKEMTPEQILDKIDKMAIDMDLGSNIFNAYFTSLEQGRCVLALTPLETDEEGRFGCTSVVFLV